MYTVGDRLGLRVEDKSEAADISGTYELLFSETERPTARAETPKSYLYTSRPAFSSR